MACDNLIAMYLDYVNDYLTVSRYADNNGLTYEEAKALIDLARKVYMRRYVDKGE